MEDNIQLMDNYLQGSLDKDGLKMFDKKLKQEPTFESEFRELRDIQIGSKASARLSIMTNLENLEMSIQEKETTKTNYTMKKLVSVAASLILIATVSYFTVFDKTNVASGPTIYNEHYETYENLESKTERDGASAIVTLKDRANFAYNSKDFMLAATLFSEILQTEQTAANYFHAGIANIEIGDHTSATKNLNTVVNNYEDIVELSQWYLAMNLLKEDTEESMDAALSSLVALSLGNTSFKSKAEEVLAKMGLSSLTSDDGVIIVINERPIENDAPDGSQIDSRGKRRFQWGEIIASNGNHYKFFNDNPISGLRAGDPVDILIVREPKGNNKMGFAFIL